MRSWVVSVLAVTALSAVLATAAPKAALACSKADFWVSFNAGGTGPAPGDQERFNEMVSAFAAGMLRAEGPRAQVIAYIDRRESKSDPTLGLRRAEAIRGRLIALGLPPSAVEAFDGGLQPDWLVGKDTPDAALRLAELTGNFPFSCPMMGPPPGSRSEPIDTNIRKVPEPDLDD